ncbi:MAG: DsbE family thiol:disulfide interchange protein [Burkholderiales bacterium]|nr:DsbE family thiol:disulfide interchange protein [Burkholderiales bacterium]
MKRYLIPLAVFVVLAGFLAVGLRLDPREVPSPLVGKPAPAFVLPRLEAPAARVARDELLGRPWVLNVWASWCVPCLAEHPLVTELARTTGVPVVGLNYKDKHEDATGWLARHGNPYAMVLVDRDGAVGIDYGVYGVPETFVVDKDGIIRHKQIGPITPEALREDILPLLRGLGG